MSRWLPFSVPGVDYVFGGAADLIGAGAKSVYDFNNVVGIGKLANSAAAPFLPPISQAAVRQLTDSSIAHTEANLPPAVVPLLQIWRGDTGEKNYYTGKTNPTFKQDVADGLGALVGLLPGWVPPVAIGAAALWAYGVLER